MSQIGFQRSPVASISEPIHSAGVPVVIYGFNVIAEVTGTGPIVRYNQTDSAVTNVIQVDTTADVPTTVMFPEGVTFPNGCYVDVESASDVVQVTTFYTKV